MANRTVVPRAVAWLEQHDDRWVTKAELCRGAGISKPTAAKVLTLLNAAGRLAADLGMPGHPRYRVVTPGGPPPPPAPEPPGGWKVTVRAADIRGVLDAFSTDYAATDDLPALEDMIERLRAAVDGLSDARRPAVLVSASARAT